jgi:hypothetical protein
VRIIVSLALLALFSLPRLPGDQHPASAQAEAESWLRLVTSGRYAESRMRAAPSFRKAVTLEQWRHSCTGSSAQLGAFRSRSLASAQSVKDPPGYASGDYVILQYDSDFEYNKGAAEMVVLVQLGRRWRVAGYWAR